MTTICFDFDGVLSEYDGWNDGIFGAPLPAGATLLKMCWDAGYETILQTCRLNPSIRGKEAANEWHEKIIKWLTDTGLDNYIHRIETQGKPIADYYVDDRGIPFSQEKAHDPSYALELFSIIKQTKRT